MPKVSIITRTKDRPLLLERAIKSVLSQTFKDWEHIIIEDNIECVNQFNELIDKYKDAYEGRLKIITNGKRAILDASINLGLEVVEGDYFVIHDDDDSWLELFLESTVGFLDDNPIPGAVVTSINYIIEEIVDNEIKTHYDYPCIISDTLSLTNLLYSKNYPSPIASLFRVECLTDVGFFNHNLHKGGDKEYFLRLAAKKNIAVLKSPLANYHVRPYNISVYGNCTLNNSVFEDAVFWEKKMYKELMSQNYCIWLYSFFVGFIRQFLENKKIKQVFVEATGKKVALYGAGIKTIQLIQDHKKYFKKINIVAVFDQNSKKHGSKVGGYLILSPEEIKNVSPEQIIITVANHLMVKSFIEDLIKKNDIDCDVIALL